MANRRVFLRLLSAVPLLGFWGWPRRAQAEETIEVWVNGKKMREGSGYYITGDKVTVAPVEPGDEIILRRTDAEGNVTTQNKAIVPSTRPKWFAGAE